MSPRRRILSVLAALALSAGSAAGQAGEPSTACGTLGDPRRSQLGEWYASWFHRPETAEWIAMTQIRPLQPPVHAEVLTNAGECARVMDEAIKMMRAWFDWAQVERHGYVFQLYRIGPYYVVHHDLFRTDGRMELSNVQVFAAETMVYLGAMRYPMQRPRWYTPAPADTVARP